MNRKEFVNQVFDVLENNHINLFHDISKEDFEKHKNKFLKNIDSLNDIQFDAGMLKLFALFKDAHTNYYGVDFDFVNANVQNIGKEFFIKIDNKFERIYKVNGFEIDDVVEKLKQLISYEVEPWALHRMNIIKSPKALKMVEMGRADESILFETESGNKVLTTVSIDSNIKNGALKKNFEFKIIDDILCVKYSVCRDEKDYSFLEFVEDIKKSCEKIPKGCLIDIRNNVGGNSDIINPLIKWLKEENIKTYTLFNGATFSSGTYAIATLKKELNATLLGTQAGQPTERYGQSVKLAVDGVKFQASAKFFSFTDRNYEKYQIKPYYSCEVFDYDGAIKPDVFIEQDIESLNNGVDGQLQSCFEYIEKDLNKNQQLERSK